MSVGRGFDPSREWLGIDAVDLADPFRALGLAATESDPAVVTAAAERLLDRLRGAAPGPFRLAHESLRKRIEACRDEVLAVVATRPRPAAAGGFVPPPLPPGLATAGAGGQPGAALSGLPPLPPPLILPDPAAAPLAATAPTPDADAVAHAAFELTRPRRRSPDSPAATPALASLLAVVAVGVAAYVLWPYLDEAVRRPRQAAARKPAVSPPAGSAPRPAVPSPAPAPDPAFSGREPPTQLVDPEPVRPRRPPRPRPEARTEPGTPPEPARPEPVPFEPAPPPPPPSREQRARAAAAVEKALGEAYAALRRGEFDAADRQVAVAARVAREFEGFDDRITWWRQLAVYARQAAALRDRALLAASGDYDVGRTRIAVIESTPEVFKFRVRGETRRVPPSEIPQPIVTTILRSWFRADDKPGNHVFLGVHLLLRTPPETAGARSSWARAEQGGEDVSNLQPLLDDPIIRAAADEPDPGRGQ